MTEQHPGQPQPTRARRVASSEAPAPAVVVDTPAAPDRGLAPVVVLRDCRVNYSPQVLALRAGQVITDHDDLIRWLTSTGAPVGPYPQPLISPATHTIAAGGSLVVPPQFLAAAGIQPGERAHIAVNIVGPGTVLISLTPLSEKVST